MTGLWLDSNRVALFPKGRISRNCYLAGYRPCTLEAGIRTKEPSSTIVLPLLDTYKGTLIHDLPSRVDGWVDGWVGGLGLVVQSLWGVPSGVDRGGEDWEVRSFKFNIRPLWSVLVERG